MALRNDRSCKQLGKRKNSLDLFATAIASTQMPMIITDPHLPDNPIIFANEAFERLTGYTQDDLIGRNCRLLQGPATDQRALDRLRTAIRDETAIQVDLLNYRKDGSTFWNSLYLSPARGDDGAVRFFLASQIDVTERVEAARVIAEQKEIVQAEIEWHALALKELVAAKALADNAVRQKADFLANMSHELRTPLTGLLGLHDLLQADVSLGPKQRRLLIMARDAGRSLLTIVNDILEFSKIEAGELAIDKQPFALLPLIESCEDLTAEAARVKSLYLGINVPSTKLLLLGDANRLKQVLMNLLTNAITFTDRGSVTVTSSFKEEAGRVRFEIVDTGIGIAEHQLPLMFRRFSQADTSITRRFGGTGLGLAICQRLVDLMGGQIGVTSELGHGSTFWFEVPTQVVNVDPTIQDHGTMGVIPSTRILLAEDNLVNQEIIKSMLEARGHHVTLVDNGAAAASAARSSTGFDLILMDVQMPIMDGLSATQAIRSAEKDERRSPIPIIGLTANALAEDVDRCLRAGMGDHVAKPIEWAGLFAAMERATVRGRPTTQAPASAA